MKQPDKIPESIEDWSISYTGRILPFIGISVAFHLVLLAILVILIVPSAGGSPRSNGISGSSERHALIARNKPLISGFEAPARQKVFPVDYFRKLIPWSPSPANNKGPVVPETGPRMNLVDNNAVGSVINSQVVDNLPANGIPGGGSGNGSAGSGEGSGGLGEGNGGTGNGSGGDGAGTGGGDLVNSVVGPGFGITEENPESDIPDENQNNIIPRGDGVDIESLLAQYIESVKAAIRSAKSYPQISLRLHETGSAIINFTLAANGDLTSVSLADSSGYDRLDQEALKTVRTAAPFDPIPTETARETLSLSITLIFELN